MAVTLHAHAHLPRHGSMRFGSSPGSMPVPVSLQIHHGHISGGGLLGEPEQFPHPGRRHSVIWCSSSAAASLGPGGRLGSLTEFLKELWITCVNSSGTDTWLVEPEEAAGSVAPDPSRTGNRISRRGWDSPIPLAQARL
jgi:hypothetical protein